LQLCSGLTAKSKSELFDQLKASWPQIFMRVLRALFIALFTAFVGWAPRKQDETWSDWILATQRADLTAVPESERMALRYRVQPIDD